MAPSIVVTFLQKTPVDSLRGYAVWSYTVDPGDPAEIVVGQAIALGLPATVDIRNPGLFPDEPLLSGMFVEQAATGQLAGREVTAAGVQTLSFVAPDVAATDALQLMGHDVGEPWEPLQFVAVQGGPAAETQVLTGPAPGASPGGASSVYAGRPAADFAGQLPYASELFGVYQPLAGWLGRQSLNRIATIAGGLDPRSARREVAAPAAVDVARHEQRATLLADQRATLLADQPDLARVVDYLPPKSVGWLSPIGLVNLFRQYFFEFDNFLGPPSGHIWIGPGGTVEVIEVSTRRTVVEKTTEQSETTNRKVEETLTEQDDVADAVKEENANDTKLGVSATGGVNMGVYHGEATASASSDSTVKKASEQTHKRTRIQSNKVSSEITRNFKTTFRTVTETTDTTSRRYVVQNPTPDLINYELRRKMRKVGVQVQHIGTRLSWQVYLDTPGLGLGLGDMVHLIPEPDTSAIRPPDLVPIPATMTQTCHLSVPFLQSGGGNDSNDETYVTEEGNHDRGIHKNGVGEHDDTIQFWFEFMLPPPPPGYTLSRVGPLDFHGATVTFTIDSPDHGNANPDLVGNKFALRLTAVNFHGSNSLPFDATLIYEPTAAAIAAAEASNAAAQKAYDDQVARLRHEAYINGIRDRLKLASGISPRPADDLRNEERQVVYGNLIEQLKLPELANDPQLDSELIRQIFDVDEMLYFAVPEYWNTRPSGAGDVGSVPATPATARGRYPVPAAQADVPDPNQPMRDDVVASWYSLNDQNNPPNDTSGTADPEHRINYLITEDTQPAPMGSSLGWLIQLDGDERRNEFLNAAWVKAVLPVRPGHEVDALQWLATANVEGEEALSQPYEFQPGDDPAWQGQTLGEVLEKMAAELQAQNTDIKNTLASETVFEHGFDPLEGGFKPAAPYEVFDQWVEVLPTDQIVAVAVAYDPKNGQML